MDVVVFLVDTKTKIIDIISAVLYNKCLLSKQVRLQAITIKVVLDKYSELCYNNACSLKICSAV
jgi:hypothetical protein